MSLSQSSILLESTPFLSPKRFKFSTVPKSHPHLLLFRPHKFPSLRPKLTLQPAPPPTPLPPPKNDRNNKTAPFADSLTRILDFLKFLKKPAVAAILLGFLLFGDRRGALAATGGRIGRSDFSSSSSSSRNYSDGPQLGIGGYSAPYYNSTPFGGGGFYVGPAVAVSVGAGAGSWGFLLMMGYLAFVALSGFHSDGSDGGSVVGALQKTSVIKLQVGLLGLARSFQQELDRIAEAADTSTSKGLSYILTETTLALLRHPDYCISAYSSVDIERSIEDGEKHYSQLSIEERGKFDEETLVNVNNVKRKKTTNLAFKGLSNEYIVVTILVAAEGEHKLPVINSTSDLKAALAKLASIPPSKTLAVEVLWTPQNENDTLSEQELDKDYPLLRPF